MTYVPVLFLRDDLARYIGGIFMLQILFIIIENKHFTKKGCGIMQWASTLKKMLNLGYCLREMRSLDVLAERLLLAARKIAGAAFEQRQDFDEVFHVRAF